MITSVTTSTITTVTMIAALGWTVAIGVAATVALIAFLTTKELAGASLSPSLQRTTMFLNIAIVPMVMVFAVIVAVKIAAVLG